VDLEAAFEEEHKHLFNDFGINMRKNKMYDQALQYYLRAEELVRNDEHLFHNIARCYFEKGNVEACKEYLLKSFAVNPNLEASRQFWVYLKGKGYVKDGEGPDIPIEAAVTKRAPSSSGGGKGTQAAPTKKPSAPIILD
jgi:tetratricopeptide (TPR) repeat protein